MMIDVLGGIGGVRWLAAALFLVAVGAMELGRLLGRRRFARDGDEGKAGLGPVEGAVFGLLGLMVAFTFSGAASRLDHRRALSVEEANDIGTAYLRVDLLPAASQPVIRGLFRTYTDARLDMLAHLDDRPRAEEALAKTNAIQSQLWAAGVTACRSAEEGQPTMLFLPALNQMFDVSAARTMAFLHHPPGVIYAMLFALTVGSALLAGYATGAAPRRSLLHTLGFAAITTLAIYVILELEYPRHGLVRVDSIDRVMHEVRAGMGTE